MKSKLISTVTAISFVFGAFSVFSVSVNAEAEPITNAEELYSAMQTGGTYKVADGVQEIDCSVSELAVSKAVEIDLNGATVLVDSNGFNFKNVDGDVTIKNGTISGSGNYGIKCMATNKPSTVNIENITTEGMKNGVATANSYYTVNIKGGNLNGTAAGIACSMGYYDIEGANISGITAANASAISVDSSTINSPGAGISTVNNASVEIIDSTVTGTTYGISWASDGTLDINGSNIINNANGKGTLFTKSQGETPAVITINDTDITNNCETVNKAYVYACDGTDKSSVTINGGTFKGLLSVNANAATKLLIKGGIFSSDPSEYLDDGLAAYKNEDGMFEVIDAEDMPSEIPTEDVTEAPDKTPQPSQTTAPGTVPTEMPQDQEPVIISTGEELYNALINGGTYKIADGINNIDCGELAMSVRKSVSIDFNNAAVTVPSNGFDVQGGISVRFMNGTVNGSGTYAVKAMAKTPSLIILDNIITEGVKNGVAVANSYYSVYINGGRINGTAAGIACTMGNINVDGAVTGGITANNASSVKLTDTQIDTVGSAVAAYNSASVEMDGCTVNGANYGLFWKSSGSINVNNSSIISSTNGKGTVNLEGTTATVTITDTDISNTNEAAAKAYIITTNAADASDITIDGGTYKGVIAVNSGAATKLKIKSGVFSNDPSAYIVKDSDVTENEDGMYEVIENTTELPDEPTLPPTEKPSDTPTETPGSEPTQTPGSDPTETPGSTPTDEPDTPTETPSANAVYKDGKIECVFSGTDKEGIVYAAEYDDSGLLKNLKAVPLDTSVVIDYPDKTGEIRIFVWDLEQQPLFDVIKL